MRLLRFAMDAVFAKKDFKPAGEHLLTGEDFLFQQFPLRLVDHAVAGEDFLRGLKTQRFERLPQRHGLGGLEIQQRVIQIK